MTNWSKHFQGLGSVKTKLLGLRGSVTVADVCGRGCMSPNLCLETWINLHGFTWINNKQLKCCASMCFTVMESNFVVAVYWYSRSCSSCLFQKEVFNTRRSDLNVGSPQQAEETQNRLHLQARVPQSSPSSSFFLCRVDHLWSAVKLVMLDFQTLRF